MSKPITIYDNMQRAYDHFNSTLFHGNLPDCLITLQRRRGARGYFLSDAFDAREKKTTADEIAMCPNTFVGRSDKDVLSTLAHEMAHVWQQHYGKPSRNGYHNMEWAKKMLEIGLTPVSISSPGGMTGQKLTHEIASGERFDIECDILLGEGVTIEWEEILPEKQPKENKKNKIKFSCECQSAWGKPDLHIICGECGELMMSDL